MFNVYFVLKMESEHVYLPGRNELTNVSAGANNFPLPPSLLTGLLEDAFCVERLPSAFSSTLVRLSRSLFDIFIYLCSNMVLLSEIQIVFCLGKFIFRRKKLFDLIHIK